jgi:hypothetical protein
LIVTYSKTDFVCPADLGEKLVSASMQVELVGSSEALVRVYQALERHIPELHKSYFQTIYDNTGMS